MGCWPIRKVCCSNSPSAAATESRTIGRFLPWTSLRCRPTRGSCDRGRLADRASGDRRSTNQPVGRCLSASEGVPAIVAAAVRRRSPGSQSWFGERSTSTTTAPRAAIEPVLPAPSRRGPHRVGPRPRRNVAGAVTYNETAPPRLLCQRGKLRRRPRQRMRVMGSHAERRPTPAIRDAATSQYCAGLRSHLGAAYAARRNANSSRRKRASDPTDVARCQACAAPRSRWPRRPWSSRRTGSSARVAAAQRPAIHLADQENLRPFDQRSQQSTQASGGVMAHAADLAHQTDELGPSDGEAEHRADQQIDPVPP